MTDSQTQIRIAPDSPQKFHRTDIDFLRAAAVIAVVAFHAGFLPGGFIGVDIFFVLSGFLMAALFTPELTQQKPLTVLKTFYLKRARRLIPAYVAIFSVIAIAGLFILLPSDIRDFGRSLKTASLFYSNHFFAEQGNDYFEAAKLTEYPYLHSWSLSVEVQYYLIFPLLVLIMRNWRNSFRIAAFFILCLASVFVLREYSNEQSKAFYLMLPRFWELGFGALVFWGKPEKRFRGLGFGIGCLILVATFAYFTPATPTPSDWTFLPILGTCLILGMRIAQAGAEPLKIDAIVRPIMEARITRFFADISYSLYLWHWSLFALTHYALGEHLDVHVTIILIIASIGLATVTTYSIERPFKRLQSLWPLIIMVAFLFGLGVLVRNHGPEWSTKLKGSEIAQLAAGQYDRLEGNCLEGQSENAYCALGVKGPKPSFFVWGNSFARMWLEVIDRVATEEKISGGAAVLSGCRPLIAPYASNTGAKQGACIAFNIQTRDKIVKAHTLFTLMIAADWQAEETLQEDLVTFYKPIADAGHRLIFILPPPANNYDVPRTLAQARYRKAKPPPLQSLEEHEAKTADVRQAITAAAKTLNAEVLDPAPYYCDAAGCRVEADGHALYSDKNHLSRYGALQAAPLFKGQLSE